MATKLNVTIPDWLFKELTEEKPKNLSERVTELILKGKNTSNQEVEEPRETPKQVM